MKVHDFPVTDAMWTAYLHGYHYAGFDRRTPVVNVLLMLWQAARAGWPDATEAELLRWVCVNMQDFINEQFHSAVRTAEWRTVRYCLPEPLDETPSPGEDPGDAGGGKMSLMQAATFGITIPGDHPQVAEFSARARQLMDEIRARGGDDGPVDNEALFAEFAALRGVPPPE